MSCGWVLQRGHSGDGCDIASNLCKYDLRKENLFILSWAMVLLMCGACVRNISLLPLVARCIETIDVYGACLFLCLL